MEISCKTFYFMQKLCDNSIIKMLPSALFVKVAELATTATVRLLSKEILWIEPN